jgi:hypothetical protein
VEGRVFPFIVPAASSHSTWLLFVAFDELHRRLSDGSVGTVCDVIRGIRGIA